MRRICPQNLDRANQPVRCRSTNLVWSALNKAAGLEDERMDVIWKYAELMTQPLSEDRLIDINSTAFEVRKFAL